MPHAIFTAAHEKTFLSRPRRTDGRLFFERLTCLDIRGCAPDVVVSGELQRSARVRSQ